MTSNRYVVLNCPAITTGWNDKDYICNTHQMGCGHCQDCTDCVIKQVIEKCKKIAKDHYWGMREIKFSKEILQLFDIEEINK